MRLTERGFSKTCSKAMPSTGVLGVLAALAVLAATPTAVFAISNPDTIEIINVRAYDSVLESSDLLVVVKYNADYTSLPTETITEAYIGRFLVEGSEVKSVAPVAFNDRGWGQGVFSFYWTANEKSDDSIEYDNTNSESYQVVFQGLPGVFDDPPKITNTGILWRDSSNTSEELTRDITNLATQLEGNADWAANAVKLLGEFASRTALTSDGEDYFGRAIPNLAAMIPDLVSSSLITPNFDERDHGTSESDRLLTFWDGTAVDTALQGLADLFQVPKNVSTSFIAFGFIMAIAFVAGKQAGSNEFGLITTPFSLALFTTIGWVPMAVSASLGLISVILLGWVFFLRRAT